MDGLINDILSKKFYKEVGSIDIEELRKKILLKWQNEELLQVHDELSSKFNSSGFKK